MTTSILRRLVDPVCCTGRITALVAALLLSGCDKESKPDEDEPPESGTAEVTAAAPASSTATTTPAKTSIPNRKTLRVSQRESSAPTMKLPYSGSVSTSGNTPGFLVRQTGSSSAAGRFERITSANTLGQALDVISNGTGYSLVAENLERGGGAFIRTRSPVTHSPALWVQGNSGGQGTIGTGVYPAAMYVTADNPKSMVPAVGIENHGRGPVLNVNHRGTVGTLATFQVKGVNQARIDMVGRGFFNGGTRTGGADLAEAFEVEGSVSAYEPGDVITISEASDRTIEKSNEPYSSRVIGVYATKPGVLLTDRDIDASLDDMVPVGMIGVIPTKVSAENGVIRRGDLLVTARTQGHAMLGTQRDRLLGAVLGKALAEFRGPGTGKILVLVNVK